MADSKHTPGPWGVDGTNALGAYGVWTDYAVNPGHDGAGYPVQVCSVRVGGENSRPREERDANARLISASPDLLAACKEALRICRIVRPSEQAVALAIEKAEEKAEGE
jgi:hypothetical protein